MKTPKQNTRERIAEHLEELCEVVEVKAVAQALGVTRQSVHSWLALLPPARLCGRILSLLEKYQKITDGWTTIVQKWPGTVHPDIRMTLYTLGVIRTLSGNATDEDKVRSLVRRTFKNRREYEERRHQT